MNSNKTISILGVGWLGYELALELINLGYRVKGSTTTSTKLEHLKSVNIDPFLIDLSEDILTSTFFDSDILIINIPPGRRDPEVGINYPVRINKALESAKASLIKNVILVSSTGVYASGNASAPEWQFPTYTDQFTNAAGDSAIALIRAEDLLRKYFANSGTILRFGGLVGGERLAGRFLAGKKDIPNGQAPVNMIHREDCIGIIRAVIEQNSWGQTYNATADGHPSRRAFYTAQAEKYAFEKPFFLEELKASGKVISNENLKEDLRYTFIHPDPMQF